MTGDEKKAAEAAEKTDLQKEKPTVAPTEYKFAVRPEKRSGMEGFLNFLWNKDTGEVMGRTGMSWLKITAFYIVYYTFLAGFFSICLTVFLVSLPDGQPTWETYQSLIGNNPGLGYRPHPSEDKIESTLIWFRHGDDTGNWNGTDKWVGRLKDDLAPYLDNYYQHQERTDGRTFTECGVLGSERKGSGNICRVNSSELFQGRCTLDNNFGFPEGKPCIMIKLNRIYNWEPTPYTNESQMPLDIPEDIRREFRKNDADNSTKKFNNRVWLECHGENPADIENLGPINYYPYNGFSNNFFPFQNEDRYLSPIVFAQLEKPAWGVMIAIECKAWARGMYHDSADKLGLVHFELMID